MRLWIYGGLPGQRRDTWTAKQASIGSIGSGFFDRYSMVSPEECLLDYRLGGRSTLYCPLEANDQFRRLKPAGEIKGFISKVSPQETPGR